MATSATVKTRSTGKTRPHAGQVIHRYLLPFMVFFAIAFITGLFYYLVPRDWRWNVSQAALWIHLVSGVAGFGFLIPYVRYHYKQKGEETRNLLLLWRAFRRREAETDWTYQQRMFGHILNWLMALLGLSGLLLTVPGILWLAGVVWMAGYPAYQIANLTHLGLALAALAFIGFHVARKRKRKNKP